MAIDTTARALASRSVGYFVPSAKARLAMYGRSLLASGLKPSLPVMSSPPVITKTSNNISVVNSSYVGTNVQYNGQSPVFTWVGGVYTALTSSSGVPTLCGATTSLSDATKQPPKLVRIRFQTNANAADFCFAERQGLLFNVMIDGQLATRKRPFGFANSGSPRWVNVSFGADEVYSAKDNKPGIDAGGSGYAVDDVITLTGTTPAKVRVSQVSSGAVTNVSVEDPGYYSSNPAGVFNQVSTTGSGTGAVFSASLLAKRYPRRRMRTWELLIAGASAGTLTEFLGGVFPLWATVAPAPVPPALPSIMFIGDSITAGTYQAYSGTGIGQMIAQRLGLWDTHFVSAAGGTGWNKDNGTSLRWSHPYRIADVIAAKPDILVYIGSQNDTNNAALQDAVTSTLTQVQAALPDTLIIGIGNIMGDSTALAATIGAGFAAAPDQRRVRFLNNHSPVKWIPSSYSGDWATNADGNHPHDDALDWFANIAATYIANALIEMTSAL